MRISHPMRRALAIVACFLCVPSRAHLGQALRTGDVNGDLKVTACDAVHALRMWNGDEAPTRAGDADGDGIVDDLDVERCRSVALGRLPVILALEPERLAPGEEVLVRGQGFGDTASDAVVTFSAGATTLDVEPTSVTDTELRAVVPAAAWSGAVEVRRVAADGESNESLLHAVGDSLSFERNVQPIFARSCTAGGCHGGAFPQEALDLSTASSSLGSLVGVVSAQAAPRVRVVPFDSSASYLLEKLLDDAPTDGDRMPLEEEPLAPASLDIIEEWIDLGAPGN